MPFARKFVRKALTEWACESCMDDVLLCVSELVTNALRHGVPPGRGYLVCMRLEPAADILRVEVHDSGGGKVCTVAAPPAPDADGGRGLLLVAALADKWGVEERNPGKVVWCEFAVRGRGGARGPDGVSAAGRALVVRG